MQNWVHTAKSANLFFGEHKLMNFCIYNEVIFISIKLSFVFFFNWKVVFPFFCFLILNWRLRWAFFKALKGAYWENPVFFLVQIFDFVHKVWNRRSPDILWLFSISKTYKNSSVTNKTHENQRKLRKVCNLNFKFFLHD